ncbi:unnamed protein product, partial [Cylindrotheca closterium]
SEIRNALESISLQCLPVPMPIMFRNVGFIQHIRHQSRSRYPCRSPAPQLVHLIKDLQQRANQTKTDDFGSIYHPPTYEHENKDLLKSIRSCLTGMNHDDHAAYTKDTGMSLCFLGTGAGTPTRQRSTTATLLRLGGSSMLFDAGEGVQRQLLFARAKPSHIERIFITHLHGDHVFGLPGFLLGLQVHIMARQKDANTVKSKRKQKEMENHVIKIYGPPGLYNYIASNIILSCTKFHSLSIEVYELIGSRARRVHGNKNRGVKNPFEDTYPEYNYGLIRRKFISPEDGVWTIENIEQKTRNGILNDKTRHLPRQLRIKAAELDHLPGVVTFGFVVEEEEPPRNVDPDKAKALGVLPNGRKFDLLKHGFSVQTEDGKRTVQAEEVLKPRNKRARKITITGDNRGWTTQMLRLAENSDVLVHESTLVKEDYKRGHSTANMAGKVSGDAHAALLVLNHISSKSDRSDILGNSNQLKLIKDAKESSNGKSEVIVAFDFMELLVPRDGFRGGSLDDESRLHSKKEVEGDLNETRTAVMGWFETK